MKSHADKAADARAIGFAWATFTLFAFVWIFIAYLHGWAPIAMACASTTGVGIYLTCVKFTDARRHDLAEWRATFGNRRGL